MSELSFVQREALQALARAGDKGDSAYGLQQSRRTLDALVRRGLARSKAELGAIFFPRSQIIYRITDAGVRAAREDGA